MTGTKSSTSGGSTSGGSSDGGGPSDPAAVCRTVAECTRLTTQLNGGQPLLAWTTTDLGANPRLLPQPAGVPGAATAPVTVTITDLARFLPALAAVRTEPDGWGVVGLPTNVTTESGVVTADGELFGVDVTVRFTPRLYVWRYGDGSTRATTTPGASWAQLGQRELTDTATSHRYRDRGEDEVSVEVLYSAEYAVAGGDWIGVAGAVRGVSPTTPIRVVVEGTVLSAPR